MFLTRTQIMRMTIVAGLLVMAACSGNRTTQPAANNQPATNNQPAKAASQPETMEPQVEPGALRAGEASGSYTAKGETVTLKYAYAGRAQRFGEEAIVILLTDKEIPAEALGDEIKDQKMLLDEKIRGLEYAIMKDGYWVRYHPGQYQESQGGSLKDLVIENDTVKGSDEDKGDLTDGKYSRSVKFVAAISK